MFVMFLFFYLADKYCPLLIKEGGLPLLLDVLKMTTTRQETKDMARYCACSSSVRVYSERRFPMMQRHKTPDHNTAVKLS